MTVISVFAPRKSRMFPVNHLIFLAFGAVLAVSECECSAIPSNETVSIITKSAWKGAPPKIPATTLKNLPTGLVVIHHSGSHVCTTRETCVPLVRGIQKHHMNDNKWDDIGYNFVVGEDGNVYEGRGWGKVGAHAPKANARSVGICVIGNFTDHIPNNAALTTLKNLITLGVEENHIASNYKLVGHRQVRQTICPGDAFYREIQTWPHYASTVDLP